MNVVQPAMINRVTFAVWARRNGLRRHSNVSWFVPVDLQVPARLLNGANVNGKPYQAPQPTRQRRVKADLAQPEPTPAPEPVKPTEPEPSPEAEAGDAAEEEYR